jgi:sigma-B regulation protein RsbU (phosphoserine phosphatase)
VTAGHNPPLLFEKRTGKTRMLTDQYGLPLAVVPEGDFGHNEADLQPGDVLVLYTDGITEAFNPDGETFGTDRLEQGLARHAAEGAEAIRDALIQEVERFASGETPHDDQTLIVLEKR